MTGREREREREEEGLTVGERVGSGRAENNAACRITNYTVQRRQGSQPRRQREREREKGRLLFVLFVDYTNNVRREKEGEEKECGGGKG